jgi:hypothetical protein
VQSALRADPMLGTAFPAGRLLLVEQPGPWGRAGLVDSRFDRSVAHRLIAGLDPVGIRVLAIRRPGRTTEAGPRRWGLADCRPGRERLQWGSFHEDAELLSLPIDGLADDGRARPTVRGPQSTTVDDPAPVFLVCAHGTHDVCCAMRGRPVAAALAEVRPGQVWECSHVGGDRFAANVLVLPSGLLYGRVVESSASPMVEAADRGVVLEHHLRGRVGFPPAQQAAMAHVHREMPHLAVGDVRAVRAIRTEPGLIVVRVLAAEEHFEVPVRVEQSARQWLTCQALQPASASVYLPQSIRRVSPAGAARSE